MTDLQTTAASRARYERIAPFYDWLEVIPEWRYRSWRRHFWDRVSELIPVDGQLLEIGVGTGMNMAYWPADPRVVAVDFSTRMLARAQRRAKKSGQDALLELGDVQKLEFPDDSFDLAVMTFVMCSVPDPVRGLREVARVVQPGGHVLLMEHVRSRQPWIAKLMDLLNPFVMRLFGPNINRDTVRNVAAAGLELVGVENLDMGSIFKIVEARVPDPEADGEL